MTDQNSETKNRILEVARVLFSVHGFEGTSVRKIAMSAEVNLASINYHFESKENLLKEVLGLGYSKCSQEIEAFYRDSSDNLEETLVKLYRFFNDRSHDLMTQFKIMLSTDLGHKVISEGNPDTVWGPPGASIIVEAILKEVGAKVSERDLSWALKCLFSHVVHMCLMKNSCLKEADAIPYSTGQDIEDGIRRLSRVIVSSLSLGQ